MNDSIFRAYDIRGTCPDEINETIAKQLGKAFASYIGKGTVFTAMDYRESSEHLYDAMKQGLLEAGLNVEEIGIVPTPILYFAIAHNKLEGGIMVSASHNPPNWNGFKMCEKNAKVVSQGFGMERIEQLMAMQELKAFDNGSAFGTITAKSRDAKQDVLQAYEEHTKSKVDIKNKLRIGLDPGNGAWSGLAFNMLKPVVEDLYSINDSPKSLPDRPSEPTEQSLGELKKLVLEKKLDLGIAYDGDGDRAVFIDENGNLVPGDTALTLLVKAQGNDGDNIVYEVSCSDIVQNAIKERNCKGIMTRVGHSFVVNAMIDNAARFGGEISGHLYFDDMYGVDDAFFATLKILELVANSGKSLGTLVSELPKRERSVKEIDVDDASKFKIVEYASNNFSGQGFSKNTIDGVKFIGENGWFILRASNTSPKIRVIAEAKTKEELDGIVNKAMTLVDAGVHNVH